MKISSRSYGTLRGRGSASCAFRFAGSPGGFAFVFSCHLRLLFFAVYAVTLLALLTLKTPRPLQGAHCGRRGTKQPDAGSLSALLVGRRSGSRLMETWRARPKHA